MKTLFKASLASAFAIGFILLLPKHALAAAPESILTGTAQSVIVSGTSQALSTLTITASSTEISNTNNIQIKIPDAINAIWDQSITTPTYGGTATAPTSTSYTSNKIMLIDLGSLTAGQTLTIAGLKVYGITAESAAAALQFAVDGSTYGAGLSGTYTLAVTPATLTSPSATISSAAAGAMVTATLAFTTTTSTPSNGIIKVTFPASFVLGAVTSSSCPGMGGSFATAVSGQNVTITRSGGSLSAAGAKTCLIDNVQNPPYTGFYTTYSIETQTATGDAATIENVASVAGNQVYYTPPASADTTTPVVSSDKTAPGPVTGTTVTLGADGKSVTFNWTNPTDADLGGVNVYRSDTSGVLGTLLTKTLAGTYVDTGLTTGATYYYMLRPIDTHSNQYVSADQIIVVPAVSSGTPAPSAPTTTTPPAPNAPAAPAAPVTYTYPSGTAAYDLVKGTSSNAVYFVANGKRFSFPNEMIYKTWFADFSGVKVVSDETIASLSLGGNVEVRPGTVLIKIVSDPKVYAVEAGGKLRWVKTEDVAKSLYGNSWALKVRDLDVGFFSGYTIGADLAEAVYPTGSVVADDSGTYYIDTNGKRQLIGEAMTANGLRSEYVVNTTLALPAAGTDLTAKEAGVAYPVAD